MLQSQAGPSIEDAAQLLSSVAQPLFLSLHSQHSDSQHDSQDQQADSQQQPQHSNVLQPVTGNGNGNGVSNNGHNYDIVSTRSSGGYSSSGSSQNPHGKLTHPYGPEGFTSDVQDLQIQVWVCKPCGFLACKYKSVVWSSTASPKCVCAKLENPICCFDMRLKVLSTAALYSTSCSIWLPV